MATRPIKIDTDGKLVQFAATETSTNRVVATVDFGWAPGTEDDQASATVTGQTWVTATSPFSAIFFGTTADHEEEDAAAEGLTVTIGKIVAGVGFDVIVNAPNGTWGKYNVLVAG